MRIERSILDALTSNEEFVRKTIPYLKSEYFEDYAEKTVFETIRDYVLKYNKPPAIEAVAIDLANRRDLNENSFNSAKEVLAQVSKSEVELDWLVDQTESFCKTMGMKNAIKTAASSVFGEAKGEPVDLQKLFADALAISFNSHVGHEYIEGFENRYDAYHKKITRIPFSGLSKINKITKGGLPKKSLNVILGGTNVGKSLFMCHCAADNLAHGYNVLYITLEMSEEMTSQRIDANLLDIPLDEIESVPKEVYMNRAARLKTRTNGRLVIKEYPTASAGASNFRHLFNELKIKKNFIPDIVYIDYLNICVSSRMKMGNATTSYVFIKAVSEELRGLAVEFDLPIVTATQTTRSGFSSSDVELTDVSESFGIAQTADFILGVISTEEMQEKNLYLVKQLKSRYGDPSLNRRFMIGVDKMKMRLYDVDDDSPSDRPVMDNTRTGEAFNSTKEFNKKFFSDFK